MPFPYECGDAEESEIEPTLAMPKSQLDATQDLSPTVPAATMSPPLISRIESSSDDIEDSQIESLPHPPHPTHPSTFSFLASTASAKSPVCEPSIRRPLPLHDSDAGAQPQALDPRASDSRARISRKTDLEFARACFAGELKSISTGERLLKGKRNAMTGERLLKGKRNCTGKKVKTKVKASRGLDPSFLDLVRGVCGIFNTQTGKHANFEKVCASFFQ